MLEVLVEEIAVDRKTNSTEVVSIDSCMSENKKSERVMRLRSESWNTEEFPETKDRKSSEKTNKLYYFITFIKIKQEYVVRL